MTLEFMAVEDSFASAMECLIALAGHPELEGNSRAQRGKGERT